VAKTHVALLRGINVSGKHTLPMRDLAQIFEECGAREVATYIQSGNVVLNVAAKQAAGLAARVENEIERRFGFAPPVVLRRVEELEMLTAVNPFLPRVTEWSRLLVFFLKEKPQGTVDLTRFAPDEFVCVGREVFAYFPKGVGVSKFSNTHLDKAAGTVSTGRNWNTILKLLEMAQ
jgi:uncharacterized protein (DUF1697 family)